MKYIKKFKNLAEYEEFAESEDYVMPHLSWCEEEDEIKAEYVPEMWIEATYFGEEEQLSY